MGSFFHVAHFDKVSSSVMDMTLCLNDQIRIAVQTGSLSRPWLSLVSVGKITSFKIWTAGWLDGRPAACANRQIQNLACAGV
jgi:hypothetical protein